MGTLVVFHAHPDDECISTGGTIARAAAEGHRVVLVVATNGDYGEVPEDLADGETLVDRRRVELRRSADVLGVARVEWLGYKDSGMTGWEQNGDPGSFMHADLEEAAGRLAAILVEEQADVLTTYDWHGNYGHPDHIQVHRVGNRAGELAGTPAIFEATVNRDAFIRLMEAAKAAGEQGAEDFDPTGPADDGNPMGTPEGELTHQVDVSEYIGFKRESMRCHASQITDTSFFLQMPDEMFSRAFGTEWFIKHGDEQGLHVGCCSTRTAGRPGVGVTRLYLVRHGRAAAGWDTDPDPGLDDLGRHQAERMADRLGPLGPLALVTSPLARCQETAAMLASRWGSTARIEPLVAEIPSPEGIPMGQRIEWLRTAMAGNWTELGQRYVDFRDAVAAFLAAQTEDTVVASHFVAINAAIGAATDDDAVVIRSLDNCSITIMDVVDGHLHLVEGGIEADTLIR